MDWIFEGIGTMLIGLVLGAAGGSIITWRVMVRKHSQVQRAGDNAKQVQAGNSVKNAKQ
jgi:hypothetical protein